MQGISFPGRSRTSILKLTRMIGNSHGAKVAGRILGQGLLTKLVMKNDENHFVKKTVDEQIKPVLR